MSTKRNKGINVNKAESRVLAFVAENPNTTAKEIGEKLDLPKGTVGPTIKSLLAQERIAVADRLRQIDPETGDFLRGRPTNALKVTGKGKKAAQRIAAKIAKAQEAVEVSETATA